MLFVFLTLIIAGVSFIYLSNRHQLALPKPLSKPFKFLGLLLLVASAVISAVVFNGAAIFFVWVMMIMLGLILLPISSFLLRNKP